MRLETMMKRTVMKSSVKGESKINLSFNQNSFIDDQFNQIEKVMTMGRQERKSDFKNKFRKNKSNIEEADDQ